METQRGRKGTEEERKRERERLGGGGLTLGDP